MTTKTYYQKHKEEIKQKVKKYREKHKKEGQSYNKKYRIKLRKEIIFHYSKGKMECQLCGLRDIEVLTIDHINGGGHRISIDYNLGANKLLFYLRKKGYPDGYRILCWNCNYKESQRLGTRNKKASDETLKYYGFLNKNQSKLSIEEKKQIGTEPKKLLPESKKDA